MLFEVQYFSILRLEIYKKGELAPQTHRAILQQTVFFCLEGLCVGVGIYEDTRLNVQSLDGFCRFSHSRVYMYSRSPTKHPKSRVYKLPS